MNTEPKTKKIYESLQVGDRITVYAPTKAFHSDYAGNPVVTFDPCDIGFVGAIHVPCVYHCGNYKDEYACVDFVKIFPNHDRDVIWRTSVDYRNIQILEPSRDLKIEIHEAIILHSLDIHNFLRKEGADRLEKLISHYSHAAGAEDFVYSIHEHLMENQSKS